MGTYPPPPLSLRDPQPRRKDWSGWRDLERDRASDVNGGARTGHLGRDASVVSRAGVRFGVVPGRALDDHRADRLEGLRREVNAARREIRRNQLRCLVLALVPGGSYPSEKSGVVGVRGRKPWICEPRCVTTDLKAV